MTNRYHDGPKQFSEDMYKRVGLKTDQGSRGQARQEAANLNEERPYRLTDDHRDMTVQRRLAGLTESNAMHFPNAAGVARLRPTNDHGIMDLASTFDAIGLPRDTPRLFESRTSDEMARESHDARLGMLNARREELVQELSMLDNEIKEYEDNTPVKMKKIGESRLLRRRSFRR